MSGGPGAPAGRLMTIFSLGGLTLASHLRGGSVRCRTGFVPLDGAPRVVLDPFPDRVGRGVVENGVARLLRDGTELAARPLADCAGRGRWDDVDLLAFAASSLWTWIGLPLAVPGEGEGRQEITVPPTWPVLSAHHVLYRDGQGRVVRHDEGDLVHHLDGHCDFAGRRGPSAVEVTVATRRRTRHRDRVPVLWADAVAAAVIPAAPTESLN